MKNKINKMVKALVALFAFALAGSAWADTWTDTSTGLTWTYEVDDGEAEIYNDGERAVDPKPTGVVKIPATIAGYPVVGIGACAFEGCDEMTTVMIPSGVRSIGYSAFSTEDPDTHPYCTALELVTIPSSVEEIGGCAFYGCTAMADENGFIIVNDILFQYVGTSENVTVPAGVKEIGESAFSDCDFITSLTLPNGLVRIGEYAFQSCMGLTGLTIPASVREIGAWAFRFCIGLSMTIPDTVLEIENGAFHGCRAMSDANGFVIVRGALHYYDFLKTSVEHISIPSGVTLICSRAFRGNIYVKSVTIPYGVQEIGPNAFEMCTVLTDVVIPESVKGIGRNAFKDSALNKVYVVPDDTDRVRELIERSQFPNPGALDFDETTITPSEEFRTEIVDGIAWTYHIVKGGAEIYNEDYAAIPDTTAGAITIPSTLGGFLVVSIGDYAFEECDSLTAVNIPASVRKIGYEGFRGCTALSSVTLSDGLQTIDDYAFQDCASLSGVSVPDGVEYIGEGAFCGCSSMADANGFVIVRDVLHHYAGSAANVTVPAGVKAIGPSAFNDNDALISVAIPDGVTEIGDFAFDGCDNLASVSIPDSVQDIGSGAFRRCSSMADANGFVVVRRVLYHYAGSAASVTVPSGVQAISSGAFGQNTSITSVSIPSGVQSIGAAVFLRCSNLESVSIQSSVTRIGNKAFANSALATVHVVPGDTTRVSGLIAATKSNLDALAFNEDLETETVCTVTLDENGGTCDTSSIVCISGQQIGELPVAYKSGYTFDGWWSFKISGGVQLTPDKVVTSNSKYYARFTEKPPEYLKETVDGVEWTYCVVDGKAKISNGEDSAVPTTTSGEVTVPATLGGYPVTLIGDYAFDGCASITKVTIQSGVTGIGNFVFHSASSLKDLFIPKTVTDFTGLTFLTCSIDTIHVEKGDIDRVRTLIEATGYTSFDYDDGSTPPPTYTVTFEKNGGDSVSEASRVVESGATIGTPLPTASWSGWTFDGWFTDSVGGTQIDGTETVTGDVTYYAHWSEDAPPPDYATILGAPAGMTFASSGDRTWVAGGTVDGKTAVKSGLETTDNSKSSVLTATFSGAGTLSFYYKVSSENNYDWLTVSVDGENVLEKSGMTVTSWTKYEKELAAGDHTVVWTYNKDGSNSSGDDCAWLAEVRFAASAPPTQYTVTFDKNGGDSVSESSREVEEDMTVGIPLPEASWAGHTFDGWFTKAVGGTKIDGTETVTGDVTYYAQWTEDVPSAPANDMFANATTISGASGSVAGSNVGATYEAGEPLYAGSWKSETTVWWKWTAPADGTATFDTKGSSPDTVMGAYTGDAVASLARVEENDDSPDGGNTSKISFDAVAGTTYRIAVGSYGSGTGGSLTLNWSLASGATTYTVTFDKNGGDSVSEASRVVESGAAIGTPLPTASWAGHTFDGWFTKASGGTQIDGTETVTGDVTYYAHWTEIETEYKTWTDPGTGIVWTYRVIDNEAEIYNDDNAAIPDTTSGAITVPSTLGGYPVTRIGDWAFDCCELLTSVTVPSGVTIIGEGAFSECYELESVSLPEGLTTIKDGAFQFCEVLETVSIPSTVTSIGDGVFQDCYALADDDGFIVVSGVLFDYTGAGGDITIPSTVKTIWDGALYYTASLTGVTIPGSVKTVGYDAFGDSANLASVTFGRGVKTIGEVAFIRCAALTEARIPASVTSIGESAFSDTSLNKVYVEYGDTARVKALLEASYFDTTGVEFVEDAEPLVCTVTLELNGGSGIPTTLEVEPGAAIGLLPIPDGYDDGIYKYHNFYGWFWDAGFTDEVEPTDVVSGDCTCYAKWGLSPDLQTTVVDGIAWSYFEVGKTVTLYNNGRSVIPSDYEGSLTIPAKIAGKTVAGIGMCAFYGCTGLTSVIIPDGVEDISDKAFAWCENLQVVQFGKGTAKGTIFDKAFKGCARLRALDFKATTPVYAVADAFEDAGTMTGEGKPCVYVPKSAAKKWGDTWMGMRVLPYSYSANIVMSVRPGKETYGSITPVVSGKATEIGKKVALKAKASSKAYVFAGWYDLDTGLRVSRSASYSYLVTGEDKRLEADFVSVQDDIDSLEVNQGDVTTDDDGSVVIDLGAATESYSEPKITVKGLPSGLKYDSKTQKVTGQAKKPGVYTVTVTATNASQKKATPKSTAVFEVVVPNFTCGALPNLLQDSDAYGTIWCGVAFDGELVDCTPADPGWTVKVSGLPAGLKWATKAVVDSKTGKVVALPNTIYGVPTKAGNFTVTFTATKGKEKQVATITLKVSALPAWAAGTFNGGSEVTGAQFGDTHTPLEGIGQATLTVAANGKMSGKFLESGRTWTLSAASFAYASGGGFHATLAAKSGKETRSADIEIAQDAVGGQISVDGGLGSIRLFQTNWKAEPWKTVAKSPAFAAAIKTELQYDRSDHEKARSAKFSLKIAASGAVTVKGEFNLQGWGYKGSASAVLVPESMPDPTSGYAFDGLVFAYIPPKAGKFVGYYECVRVRWDGTKFTVVD